MRHPASGGRSAGQRPSCIAAYARPALLDCIRGIRRRAKPPTPPAHLAKRPTARGIPGDRPTLENLHTQRQCAQITAQPAARPALRTRAGRAGGRHHPATAPQVALSPHLQKLLWLAPSATRTPGAASANEQPPPPTPQRPRYTDAATPRGIRTRWQYSRAFSRRSNKGTRQRPFAEGRSRCRPRGGETGTALRGAASHVGQPRSCFGLSLIRSRHSVLGRRGEPPISPCALRKASMNARTRGPGTDSASMSRTVEGSIPSLAASLF